MNQVHTKVICNNSCKIEKINDERSLIDETMSIASETVNIIMVDDDIDDIYVTKRRLAKSKIANNFLYETKSKRVFETLSSIQSKLNRNSNIILLLDINMPQVDGIEILHKLKSDPQYKDMPVLMLCTSDDVVDMLDSYTEGADGYLVKPIVTDEMLAFLSMMRTHQPRMQH